MGDFLLYGQIIGNGGFDNGKLIVINDKSLTDDDLNKLVEFIKTNSGNASVFCENYSYLSDKTIEIESDKALREAAYMHFTSLDNGKGGTRDGNNQEHGGYTSNGVFYPETSGSVSSPCSGGASIDITPGYTSYHSHGSGTSYCPSETTPYVKEKKGFEQLPSQTDIDGAGENAEYVFAMRDGQVYVYNKKGIMASIPMEYFVTKKNK